VAVALGVLWRWSGAPDLPAGYAPPPAQARAEVQAVPLLMPGGDAVVRPNAALAPLAPRASLSAASVYGRNGRPLALNGASIAQYIAARAARARQGDLKAGYELYQALSLCARRDEPLPEFARPAERDAAVREQAALQRDCLSISPAQVQERLRWLSAAAQSGNPAAQIDFYMEGPFAATPGRPLDPEQAASDPAVAAWKAEALGHLRSAAAQCDSFAMGLLATLYDSGELSPPSPRQALAYAVANAAARKLALSDEQLRDRFGEAVSAGDLVAGREAGAKLAAESCRH
jgi:hypothetical protein